MVLQAAGIGGERSDGVGVKPVAKGSFLLQVLELAALDVALVDGDPGDGERRIAHLQDYPGAVADAAGMFDDADGFAGWDEERQGVGALVESKHFFGSGWDDGFVFEDSPHFLFDVGEVEDGVKNGEGEELAIDAVEHAAVAGEEVAAVFHSSAAFDGGFGQVA